MTITHIIVVASTSGDDLLPSSQKLDSSLGTSSSHGYHAAVTGKGSTHSIGAEENVIDTRTLGQGSTNGLGDDGDSLTNQPDHAWLNPGMGGNNCENAYSHQKNLDSSQTQATFARAPFVDVDSDAVCESRNITSSSISTFSDPLWFTNGPQPQTSSSAHMLSHKSHHSLFSDHLDFLQKLLQQNGYAEKHTW